MTEAAVRAAFRRQAEFCAELGSPFTARLCRLAADRLAQGGGVAGRVLGWTGDPSSRADALPLRFAGALLGLVLVGRDPALAAVYPPRAPSDDALWFAVEAARAPRRGDRRPPQRPAADQRAPAQHRADRRVALGPNCFIPTPEP